MKVAIIVDCMGGGGQTDVEEVQMHKRRFTRLLRPIKPKFYRAYSAYSGEHGIQGNTDMVIFDYGGMLPGNDLMESNSRELVKWAMDHPSSLVVVVSSFTYQHAVVDEMKEAGFESLPNVIYDDDEEKLIPSWFREASTPPERKVSEFCQRCRRKFDDPLISHTGQKTRCTECGKVVCDGCLVRENSELCLDCAPRFNAVKPRTHLQKEGAV
jgi:hypothetical protein